MFLDQLARKKPAADSFRAGGNRLLWRAAGLDQRWCRILSLVTAHCWPSLPWVIARILDPWRWVRPAAARVVGADRGFRPASRGLATRATLAIFEPITAAVDKLAAAVDASRFVDFSSFTATLAMFLVLDRSSWARAGGPIGGTAEREQEEGDAGEITV